MESFVLQGFDGIPFKAKSREDIPVVKKNDAASNIVRRSSVGVKVFTLSDDKNVEDYKALLSDITDSSYKQLSQDIVKFDEKTGNFVAFVRWIELWLETRTEENVNKGMPYDG